MIDITVVFDITFGFDITFNNAVNVAIDIAADVPARTARIGNDISNSHNARDTTILSTLIRTVVTDGIFTTIATSRIMSRAANNATSTTRINTTHNITTTTDMSDVSLGNLSSEVLTTTSDGGTHSPLAGETSTITAICISAVYVNTVYIDTALHPGTIAHVSELTLGELTSEGFPNARIARPRFIPGFRNRQRQRTGNLSCPARCHWLRFCEP